MKNHTYILLILLFSINLFSQTLHIDTIKIKGNKITKPSIILKELSFKQNQNINEEELIKEIKQSKINILNTGLFNFVEIDYNIITPNVYISITLVEQWYIWPIPFIEHADRNFSSFLHNADWTRVNYGLFLEINNFRGRREQLKFKIRGGYKEQYGFMYSKPNIDYKQKHGLSFETSYFRQHEIAYKTQNNTLLYYRNDSQFTQTDIRSTLTYDYRQTLYDFHSITLQYMNRKITDTIADLNPDYFGNEQTKLEYLNLSYSFTNEHRNYIFYPTNGYVLHLAYNRKIFFNSQNKDINSFVAEYRWYKKITKRISFGQNIYGKLSDNTKQAYSIIEGFGYSHYLRAYEFYVIDGYNSVLLKNNIRYNLLKRKNFTIPAIPWTQFNKSFLSIYINGFLEAGYVSNHQNYDKSNTFVNTPLYSAGFGIDLVTYYETIIRFEYSINHIGESGFFIHMGSGI